MFNYIEDKEYYIDFMDDNYLDSYSDPGDILNEDDLPETDWFVMNRCSVFYNQGEIETFGGWFYNTKSPNVGRYVGEYTDGSYTIKYRQKNIDDGGDPITQWEALITNVSTGVVKIKSYESSKMVRAAIGNLNTGSNYEDYDRAPIVNWWLGRSWIENEEEELHFLVESREMLDSVASYYSLPVPYDDYLRNILDDDLESFRFKSYDLNQKGEGHFVAVVVAGVVFENNIATKLKLYEIARWND